jgi:polyhydroxyalkanoate synthase subunit PhaC
MGGKGMTKNQTETRRDGTTGSQDGKGPDLSQFNPLRPDLALGLWTSWMETHVAGEKRRDEPEDNKPWWVMAPDDVVGNLLATGTEQLQKGLGMDPLLASIDRVWNANPLREVIPVDWAEVARSLRTVWLHSLRDPATLMTRSAELNMKMWTSAIEAWNAAGARWWGLSQPEGKTRDKRFDAPEWQTNPIYRTLNETYLLASDFLLKQTEEADGLDPAERQRLSFHLQQFVNAMSPTLLLLSNPAALRRAMETAGGSLADGARNLLRDLAEGRLTMTDMTAYTPGKNLATTPGKVVYRNRLIELIQYSPETEQVHATPLLFMPPWINKFYILDMQPKNSMVRYLVQQGFTVFVISWKNPDASMENIAFEDYMTDGPLAASDVARAITGSKQVIPIGYCIGGTLLSMTMAWLAAEGDDRFKAATLIVTMQDFSHVGDTAVFMDEPQIAFIEQQMMERGYLDSREMSNMFNLLRSNDLIWANVVNNYLMGNKPTSFDLLYWNADGTRMARTAHSWYLRNTYVENNVIVPGKITLKGQPIDLRRITTDLYAIGAEKDHIVPWEAAWRVTQLTSGKVRFVMSSSGHIAGIINPPGGKGYFFVNESAQPAASPQEWLQNAERQEGSWWTDWTAWLAKRAGRKVKAPPTGNEQYPPLCDAPGTYVLEK